MDRLAHLIATRSLDTKRLAQRLATLAIVCSLLSAATSAMATDSGKAFIAADVHPSPFRREPEPRGNLIGGRYSARDEPMLNLIAAAYGIDPKYIVGGPSWLEWDRFDIFAKSAPNASRSDVREMLRNLLIERFKLITHTDTKPEPAFILTVHKGKLKLKQGSGDTGCTNKLLDGTVGLVEETCHNVTMEVFAKAMRNMAGAYVNSDVVDSTGLKGTWDIDIRWTAKKMLDQAGPDGISFFDALNKQLGLHLIPGTAPLPVLVVDSVNETPTPNVPDLAKLMPPTPIPDFEVSVIKPSKPNTPLDGDISGGQVNLQGASLDVLIRAAWDLPDDGPMLQGVPKWLTQNKFDVLAKAPREPGEPPLDQDDMRPMLQKLLAERFKLSAHLDDQTMDTYNLVALKPKLKKSEIETRTKCVEGPGPDGKDPRIKNPILNRLRTCQGITMAQLAQTMQTLDPGYIKTPVVNATGINGAYDFTLSFTEYGKLFGKGRASSKAATTQSAADADSAAPAPNGAVSLFDALPKQLGLKLEKVRRTVPVLVIDHVDQRPTEN